MDGQLILLESKNNHEKDNINNNLSSIYIYEVVISVYLFVSPILTEESLD